MIVHYSKIGCRNLMKLPLFSFINIFGLAIGLAFFTIAALFSKHNFSYDSFHTSAKEIYTLVQHEPSVNGQDRPDMRVLAPVYNAIRSGLPEVKASTQMFQLPTKLILLEEESFYESRVFLASSNIFSFFSFELILGNAESVLSNPSAVAISEQLAQKYYGDNNPMGQIIHIDGWDHPLLVSGIFKKIPANSSIKCDMIISTVNNPVVESMDKVCLCFVRLNKMLNEKNFDNKLSAHIRNHVPNLEERNITFSTFALQDIHLHSMHIQSNYQPSPAMIYWVVLVIGVVFLVIVCLNYMNLATSRFMGRLNEVGLRKVVGGSRPQLIVQFLSESILIAHLALPLSIIIFHLIRPHFEALFSDPINLDLLNNAPLMASLWAVTLLVGVFSGSYPAFFLSRFKPVSIFKELSQSGIKGRRIRKVLVICQFTFALIFILTSFMLTHQINFLQDINLGFDRSKVLVVPMHNSIRDRIEVFEQTLSKHHQVVSVGSANGNPYNWGHESKVYKQGMSEDQGLPMKVYHVGYGFIKALDINLVNGLGFDRKQCQEDAVVVSQAAVRQLEWDDPLEQILTIDNEDYRIVGIVDDFHFQHVFNERAPGVLILRPSWSFNLFIKYSRNLNENLLGFIENEWNRIAPIVPFEYKQLDLAFKESLRGPMQMMNVFKMITLVALLIACMGLVGLSAFSAQRRIKEIGIRKTFGASEQSIVLLLVKDFMKSVFIAILIALPIAILMIMSMARKAWVVDAPFAWEALFGAIALSFFAALLSVGSQAYVAAKDHPISSLRND